VVLRTAAEAAAVEKTRGDVAVAALRKQVPLRAVPIARPTAAPIAVEYCVFVYVRIKDIIGAVIQPIQYST
jgi:hypothetical protein